ncbi:MAG: phosphoribosylglycinamide formyltransferase [Gammaproteobacteria bacterium]|jgi:phosphoribosylglycinamide formyltransferase-1
MSSPARLVVMISGAGSNLLALDDACRRGDLPAQIVGVLSDRPAALGLERARARGLHAEALPIAPGESRGAHDTRLLAAASRLQPDLVLLAGYMRILDVAFVHALQGRLLNIHPSLLPRYKGLHTHRRVLEAGDDVHGATVHFVTPDLDGGPPVLQARIKIKPSDDESTLAARIQRCEHVIYPTVVKWCTSGRLRYHEGKPMLDGRSLETPVLQDFDL